MPPKTRLRKPNQSTLSFNNKVSKSSVQRDASGSGKKPEAKLAEVIETTAVSEPELPSPEEVVEQEEESKVKAVEPEQEPQETTIAATQPRKKRISAASTSSTTNATSAAREALAAKITDAQIRKYWKNEEDGRLAPRVHQSQLPLHEKILRHFDLSSQYGPCIGITRLKRWKRADSLGLAPPVEVLAVLIREEEGTGSEVGTGIKKGKGSTGAGAGGRSQGCGKLAYIDELGGGRVGIVE